MKTNWRAIRIGCLMLANAAWAASPCLAQTQQPDGTGATNSVISSVAVSQNAEHASVRVQGEGPLEVQATRISNPDRLVLDFSGARIAARTPVIPGAAAPVKGVRLGQFRPDVARVVIDLTAAAPYNISHDGKAVVVAFKSQEEQPSSTPTLKAASEKISLPRQAFRYEAQSPRPASVRSSKLRNVSAPHFALPGELTQPSVVLASFGGSTEPAKPAAQQAALHQAANAAAAVANSQGTQTPAPAASGRYTGEPISVNLKDVDLKDFFRLIHEISGLNVVLDPAVKGSLTIVLDEVPWDQALDIVLQNNGLDKQLSGNVLRVATRDTLKKEAETQRDLERAQAEAIAPVTVTRVLSYGKAEKMKDTLKKFLSSRGDILSDDRSNQLIIRDIPSVIPVVDNLIRQLDRKSQQVEIEARVVSATRSFAQDIGVQLAFAGTTTSGRTVVGGNQEVGLSPINQSPITPPLIVGGSASSTSNPGAGAMPFNVNLGATAPTSGAFFGHRSPNFAVDFFISAAEAKGVGKLLSKPRVVTQNNEKATVKQGTKIPIQTTINNTISVQYIDAVLRLEVTPQITAEGTVFMDVIVENTQIDAGIPRVQGVPALDTQSAETKVLVADGGTVVIGGIIVSSQRVDITEVPIIGSLPIIGHLFRRNNVAISSQELLFFLTPRIIPS